MARLTTEQWREIKRCCEFVLENEPGEPGSDLNVVPNLIQTGVDEINATFAASAIEDIELRPFSPSRVEEEVNNSREALLRAYGHLRVAKAHTQDPAARAWIDSISEQVNQIRGFILDRRIT